MGSGRELVEMKLRNRRPNPRSRSPSTAWNCPVTPSASAVGQGLPIDPTVLPLPLDLAMIANLFNLSTFSPALCGAFLWAVSTYPQSELRLPPHARTPS
jgi:hypothetical protein